MAKVSGNGFVVATAVLSLFATQGCMSGGDESRSRTDLVQCQGINECKGTSECASEGQNSCEGMNECKGVGFLTVPEAECEEKGGTVLS
jgi:hypothetical protein